MNTPDRSPAWWKGLVGLLLAVIVTVSVAGPSMALTGSTANAASVSNRDQNDPGYGNPRDDSEMDRGVCTGQVDADGQLPVTRWDEGTEFHDRLHAASPGDIAKRLQRQGIVSLFFGVGNTAWATTTGMTEMALNFCVLDRVGGVVDRTSGKIARALMSSGIVVALVVASVLVFAWRMGRGQGGAANTKALLQKGLVLGLFAIMMFGAANSTGGGIRGDNSNYRPGAGSPGWFITQIDQAVTVAATGITGELITSRAISGAESGPTGRGRLGCAPYVKAMKDGYAERQGSGLGREGVATTPLLLSSMWENSGLEMWKTAQFGDATVGTYGRGDNEAPYTYGDLMYCRMLELNVAAKRHRVDRTYDSTVSALVEKSGAIDSTLWGVAIRDSGEMAPTRDMGGSRWNVNGDYLPWRYSTNVKKKDRTYVAWAACSAPSDAVGAPLIHKDDADGNDLRSACREFFGEEGFDGGSGTGQFDWDESDDDISDTATTEEAKDFLLTLHGNRQASGLVAGMVYMLSSLMVAGVFILFSAAILVAKITALMMMIGVVGVLVFSLAPNASMSKITDYAKQYLGLSLFAWGAQLVIGLLAFITAILVDVGNAVVPGGPGGVMGVAWVGFAPVIAVFCLHFMFKKLRVPSPLKMSGGMAWGQMAASGAVGGAAGFGAGSLAQRAGNRVKGRAAQETRNVGAKITGKDRRSRIQPDGGPAVAGATGAKATDAVAGKAGTKAAAGTAAAAGAAVGAAAGAGAGGRGGKTDFDSLSKEEQAKQRLALRQDVKQAKSDAKAADTRGFGEKLKDAPGRAASRAYSATKQAAGARASAASGAVASAASQFRARPFAATKDGFSAAKSGLGKGAKGAAKVAAVGAGLAVLGTATGGVGLAAAGGAYAMKRAASGRAERESQMLRGGQVPEDVAALQQQREAQAARTNQMRAQAGSIAGAYDQARQQEAEAARQARLGKHQGALLPNDPVAPNQPVGGGGSKAKATVRGAKAGQPKSNGQTIQHHAPRGRKTAPEPPGGGQRKPAAPTGGVRPDTRA